MNTLDNFRSLSFLFAISLLTGLPLFEIVMSYNGIVVNPFPVVTLSIWTLLHFDAVEHTIGYFQAIVCAILAVMAITAHVAAVILVAVRLCMKEVRSLYNYLS